MYSNKKVITTNFLEASKKKLFSKRLPDIFSSRILIPIFLYSTAFTLLLFGLKLLRLEQQVDSTTTQLTSVASNLPEEDSQIQKNIASEIIRLHVIANSDTVSDQTLKLQVRDSIIQDLQSVLKNSSSIEEARSILAKQLPQIQRKAEETIREKGYDYTVSVSLNQRYFPVKVYGDLTFPAGVYEALCLEIGEASGRNWWCVLFPSLCFVDETYAVVPEESKEKLQDSLSEEEYASLENQKDSDETDDVEKNVENENVKKEEAGAEVELRSGIVEWIMNR